MLISFALVDDAEREESEALDANAAFYAAFRGRDMTKMAAIWSRERLVACVHPGWQILYGRETVLASWKAILGNDSSPPIEPRDARAFVYGDVAVVTCVEQIFDMRLVATNIFVREAAGFRLVHHHAGSFAQQELGESDRLN
jgi:ketosteroid isomerase-like protein